MERLSERLAEAEAALATLDELVRLYEHEGLDIGSPKQAIRGSRRTGLLTDEQAETALHMADDRNLVVHVYREAVARDLDSRLAAHTLTLGAWIAAMRAQE